MLGALTAVVAPAFLIIGVGIVVGRAISTDLVAVNRLNLWAATPALIFHSLSTSDSLGGLGRVVLGYALFLAVMGLLAWLTSGRFSGQRQRNYVGLSLFVNSGNMMLPISLFALGTAGLDRALPLMVVTLMFQVITGPMVFSLERSALRLGERLFTMAPVLGAGLLGVLLKAFDTTVPIGIARGVETLGSAAIPLVLLTLGLQISKSGFAVPRANDWSVVGMRLVIGPIVGYATALVVGASGVDLAVLTLIAAMPPAVINYMFALEYGSNPDEVARTIALATGVSVLTLSVVVSLVAQPIG